MMRASSRGLIGAGGLLLILQGLSFVLITDGAPPRRADVKLYLNPNSASREELMLLPDVGPALADAIIAYRESRFPEPAFRRPKDLDAVHGIGDVTVARAAPYLSFDGETARSERGRVTP